MKKSNTLISLLVLSLAVFLTGCGTLSKPFFRPILGTNVVPSRVENRTVLSTNLVPVVVTNTAGIAQVVIATNVLASITPIIIPATWTVVTNGWEQRPGIDTGIQIAAGATNVFAPGIGTIGGWALSGIFTVWLTVLNRKKNTATDTAAGLVKGVEAFRQAILLTPAGAKVSDHLIDQIKANIPAATQAGLLLEQLIDEHTGNTKEQAAFVNSMVQSA